MNIKMILSNGFEIFPPYMSNEEKINSKRQLAAEEMQFIVLVKQTFLMKKSFITDFQKTTALFQYIRNTNILLIVHALLVEEQVPLLQWMKETMLQHFLNLIH